MRKGRRSPSRPPRPAGTIASVTGAARAAARSPTPARPPRPSSCPPAPRRSPPTSCRGPRSTVPASRWRAGGSRCCCRRFATTSPAPPSTPATCSTSPPRCTTSGPPGRPRRLPGCSATPPRPVRFRPRRRAGTTGARARRPSATPAWRLLRHRFRRSPGRGRDGAQRRYPHGRARPRPRRRRGVGGRARRLHRRPLHRAWPRRRRQRGERLRESVLPAVQCGPLAGGAGQSRPVRPRPLAAALRVGLRRPGGVPGGRHPGVHHPRVGPGHALRAVAGASRGPSPRRGRLARLARPGPAAEAARAAPGSLPVGLRPGCALVGRALARRRRAHRHRPVRHRQSRRPAGASSKRIPASTRRRA